MSGREEEGKPATEPAKQYTAAQLARRKRRNAKRKLDRQRCAAGRALPPVVGLSEWEFFNLTGGSAADYDAYCDKFIEGVRKARRRWEFPLEVRALYARH